MESDGLPELPKPELIEDDRDLTSDESPSSDDEAIAAVEEPARSLLLPSEQPTERSEQLERIARLADRQIRRGFELAGRRAHFAARTEFIRALRVVAQGLDVEYRTNTHSQRLAAGLTALKEAEDFIPDGSRLEADLDVSQLIDGHRTPVLKNADAEGLIPLVALECYLAFAEQQLAAAAGREVTGSMALRGLGKLHASLTGQRHNGIRASGQKSVVFFKAALLVFPGNYMAANDLGVLFAQCGNYREAEAALKRGLSIQLQPTGWRNLAGVYRQLGEDELSRRADQLATAAVQGNPPEQHLRPAAPRRQVIWLDPDAFARTGDKTSSPWQPSPVAASPALANPNRADPDNAKLEKPATASKTSTVWWLPWDVHEMKTRK